MTAAMRAVALPVSRALRVALVEDGRVIEERLFLAPTQVTLGPSEDATFVVPSRVHAMRCFAPHRGGWALEPGMRGRVVISGEVIDVGGRERLRLDRQARGRVELGSLVLLFALVDAPPPRVRAPLPASVRHGVLGDIDWKTTIVAAFSFLAHFFAVAAIYSDWADPLVDDDLAAAALVQSVDALPAPPPVEQPRAAGETRRTDKSTQKSGDGDKSGHKSGGTTTRPSGQSADARAAEIATELAALDVSLIAALDGGVATRNVLGSGEVPVGLLDEHARSSDGVSDDPGGLRLGRSGRHGLRPGERGRLDEIGRREARVDAERAGRGEPVRGPRGEIQVSPPQHPGVIPNVDLEVARMRPRFRICYQRGLEEHPEMEGSVVLVAKVAPNGEVLSVSGGGGSLGPIVPCLKAVVQAANFQASTSGETMLVVIPIRFFRQR